MAICKKIIWRCNYNILAHIWYVIFSMPTEHVVNICKTRFAYQSQHSPYMTWAIFMEYSIQVQDYSTLHIFGYVVNMSGKHISGPPSSPLARPLIRLFSDMGGATLVLPRPMNSGNTELKTRKHAQKTYQGRNADFTLSDDKHRMAPLLKPRNHSSLYQLRGRPPTGLDLTSLLWSSQWRINEAWPMCSLMVSVL